MVTRNTKRMKGLVRANDRGTEQMRPNKELEDCM